MKDMKSLMGMLNDEESSDMSPERIKAKMEVLKELLQMAEDQEAEGITGGLKKVTVAAPSAAGLKEGLEKAEDMMEEMPSEDEEMSEDGMEEDEEEDEME